MRLATDEAERAWFARAWWGYHAIRTVRAALVEGRIKEVMDLVEPMDTSHLDRALAGGRGVVLAGAHLGPYPVGRQIFSRLGCGALLLQSHPGLEAPGIKTLTLSREEDRKKSLAACFLHLRRSGVVMIAADGRWGQHFQPYPFLNGSCEMSHGTAQLARMAKAPTLWFFILWDIPSRRIRVIFEDSGLDPERGAENWNDAWIETYLRRLEEIMVQTPENLTFAGGFWNSGQNSGLRYSDSTSTMQGQR
ncbi:hypothetical protein [Holophaga foetida]|uniref:hypothetical protein n=1 Tax=Holophaga foetida TaxID=35839 RepID=UPI00047D8AB1|nr:hypothetical protein [Holophaga foetida]